MWPKGGLDRRGHAGAGFLAQQTSLHQRSPRAGAGERANDGDVELVGSVTERRTHDVIQAHLDLVMAFLEDGMRSPLGADMTWQIVGTVEVFETINTVAARTGGPPIHLHPQAEESYEVLEGALDVFLEGTWRTLEAGEKLVVPPGAPTPCEATAT